MTRKALGTALGISGPMVTKLAARGMPCHDVDAARRWRDRHLEPARRKEARADTAGMPLAAPLAPAPAAAPTDAATASLQAPVAAHAPPDYQASRALREHNEAELSGLRLAELRGELVRVDNVRHALARRAIAFRESLLQIPDRLAAVLAAETDEARVRGQLDGEIRGCLIALTEPDAP